MTAWALAGALLLSFSGMAALSLAMDRHYEQLSGGESLARLHRDLLRLIGGVLLAAALVPGLWVWSASVAVVLWLGSLSAGALAVALLMSFSARWAAGLAAGAGVLGVALSVLAPY